MQYCNRLNVIKSEQTELVLQRKVPADKLDNLISISRTYMRERSDLTPTHCALTSMCIGVCVQPPPHK